MNEINKKKILLEAKVNKSIYKVLANQTQDAVNLFAVDKLDANNIATNYIPEMLKVVRDAMRLSIATFGYSIRQDISKEFKVEFKSEIDDRNFNDINRQLSFDFSIFIANQSEQQAKLITETSAKDIERTVATQTTIKMNEVSDLIREQNELRLIDTPQAKKRIATIELIIRNAKKDVEKNIKTNLLATNKSRAKLIGEQVVGIAEAYSRNREAEVLNKNIQTSKGVLTLTKNWVSILDSKTRDGHVSADGQSVGVDDSFTVNGEALKYPRDPNGTAGNTIRCRCVAIYVKKYS